MTDDQTLASMSVMPKTQELLADHGTTFTRSFAGYSLCRPSRATLFTGQYAHNHGVLSNALPTGGYSRLGLRFLGVLPGRRFLLRARVRLDDGRSVTLDERRHACDGAAR